MNRIIIEGLKTEENEKFINFFKLLQEQAQSINHIFFLDSGEGREIFTDDLEGEDLSGWLIPTTKAALFKQEWLKNNVGDKWDIYFTFVFWKQLDNNIIFKFEKFSI